MTNARLPEIDASRCRRKKRCDWRCLGNPGTPSPSICIGCEHHRRYVPANRSFDGEPLEVVIDGRAIVVVKGARLIDVLHEHGFEIPTLCHHPLIRGTGACRICLVERQTEHGFEALTACDFTISEKITIRTSSPYLIAHRRSRLRSFLEAAPHSKPIRALAENMNLPIPKGNPADTCIQCDRCIRVCSDISARPALIRKNSGQIIRLDNSRCATCGACLVVCPTGAVPALDAPANRTVSCRLCELICPEMAITTDPDTKNIEIDSNSCKECGLCIHRCPENAIDLVARKGV